MELWDCNCWYGVPRTPPPAPAKTVDILLAEMERAGIHRAVVRNAAQWERSPEVANPILTHDCAADERLLASWAILPPQTGELGTVAEFVDAMRESGVWALWAYPEKHRYVL
ncbi:MAG: hypothetical protein GF393_07155, partial [Armatimonadia bacterium]|nr:hypothetical protein [Armatimonadia bacterium]